MALRIGVVTKIAAIAGIVGTSALVPAPSLAADDRASWLEVRSPHFRVISNASAEQARRVSAQLEDIRAAIGHALTDARADPREPVVVIAVKNEDGLEELLPQFWERRGQRPVAAYWGGSYQQCIALRVDASDRERYRRMLHEYAHFVTHLNVPEPPAWLDEGMSEFLATAVIKDDVVEVGRPPANSLEVLRARGAWLPLNELLAMERPPDPRDRRRLALFYAQSWAVVHYVMLGAADTSLTLARATNAEDSARFEAALVAYVRAARFRTLRIPLPRPGDGLAPRLDAESARPIDLAESLVTRAGCILQGERPSAALPLLTEALRIDPQKTTALEHLGYLHFQQNRPGEAASWFDRAIASGDASYRAFFYRAILSGVTGLETAATADATIFGHLPQQEGYLRRSIELNPAFAPASARLADLYETKGDRNDEALALRTRATKMEPESVAYWVDLGRLLARLNRIGEARDAGKNAMAVARSPAARQTAETFAKQLAAEP